MTATLKSLALTPADRAALRLMPPPATRGWSAQRRANYEAAIARRDAATPAEILARRQRWRANHRQIRALAPKSETP